MRGDASFRGPLYHHRVYGLRVASNRRIPAFRPAESPEPADVTVTFSERAAAPVPAGAPWYHDEMPDGGPPHLRLSKLDAGGYEFQYRDGAQFRLGEGGNRVEAWGAGDIRFEDLCAYLAGPILGFVLRLRGVVCLHASAVETQSGAVALLGPCGAGKSTAAAALWRRGCHLICEDTAALEQRGGQYWVQPGYPRINLWPDSVQVVFGSPDALPPIAPPWEKRYLALDATEFSPQAAPLRGIFVLEPRREQEADFAITRLAPAKALVALAANTYLNYLPGPGRRAHELRFLAPLAASVPVWSLAPPAGGLDELAESILSARATVPGAA